MSALHLYSASMQPATRFVDRCSGKAMWFRFKPNRLIYTDCCRKRRPAKNVVVQVYYDQVMRWCKDGKGCKGKRHDK